MGSFERQMNACNHLPCDWLCPVVADTADWLCSVEADSAVAHLLNPFLNTFISNDREKINLCYGDYNIRFEKKVLMNIVVILIMVSRGMGTTRL